MNTKISRLFLFTLLVGLLWTTQIQAKIPTGPEFFGIGVQLGDPSAITMKLMPSDIFGFQMYLGGGSWGWTHDWGNMFITGLDFVFHPMMIYDGWRNCALNWTIGVGAAVGVWRGWYYNGYDPRYKYDHYYYRDDYYATLFVRMVTGVNLWFKKIPLELFVELNPAIRMINPDPVGFSMFWTAAGARWYF